MSISIRNNIDKVIVALCILVLFSSDKNLLITHYILGKQNISLMTISFIAFLILSIFYLIGLRGNLVFRQSQKKLIIATICLAFYFGFHEIVFGDSLVSIKYSIYLAMLILILFMKYNFFYIFKILGYSGGIISMCIVIQQFLMIAINAGDLSHFNVAINGDDWGRWESCDFVLPYGLGLIERCGYGYDVSIFGVQINRSLFFMTEPKYISSMLLVTFASLLISKSNSFSRSFFLFTHLIAIFFVGALSAIFLIFLSALLVFFRFIGPKIYTSAVFLFPLFILPTLIYSILLIAGIDGFILNRFASASHSIGSGGFENISIFGQAFGECTANICFDTGLLDNLLKTYGLIGLIIFWIFLYYLIKPMFEIIRTNKIATSNIYALMLLLNTYVVFNIYFFGDIFNMFGMLILLIIIFLPEYISSKKPMVLSD